jgi:hypothetical protein
MDFLASDGALPGSGIVYVYDTPLGNGSGSSAANAKEIQAAINAATAGQTLVAIAETPGGASYYNRPSGLTFPVSGVSGNPITLMARPGDTVVIDRGQEFATFRTPSPGQNTKWELFDANKKIWRSVSTGFGGSVRRLGGHWFEFGWPHYILPAPSLTNLQAPLGRENIWTNYGSVCALVHTDGRVYIRMQKPDANKLSFGGKYPKNAVVGDWPGWANANGQIDFPVSEDPRDYAIWFSVSPGGQGGGKAFTFNSGVSNWVIGEGINSFGHETTVWLTSSNNNITLKRGTDLSTRYGILAAATGGNTSAGLTIQRRRMGIGSHRHCPLVNWKFGGPLEASHRGAGFETNWQSGGAVLSNLQATDCTFYGWHDTAVRGGPDWKFRHCTFYRIFDDGFQVDIPVAPRNEFHHCYFLDSAFGGPGGAGTMAGSWKVSHCIFDCRLPKMTDVGASLSPYSEPFMISFNLAHPDWTQGVSHPHKVYNCTIIHAPDGVGRESAPHFAHIHGSKDNGSTVFHEIWNCICCVISADRYAGNGGQAWVGPSDYAVSRMITDGASREAHDYLMIHRDCPFHPSTPNAFTNGIIHAFAGNDASPENFSTLAAWKASSKFNASKNIYSPGFLNSAIVADPQIPSAVRAPASFDTRRNYRPQNSQAVSAARSATSTSLTGESTTGWTVAPSPWMGALDPNGTTMPIGVQNP